MQNVPVSYSLFKEGVGGLSGSHFLNAFLLSRFNLMVEDIFVKSENLEKALNAFKEFHPDFIYYKFNITSFEEYHILESDRFYINVTAVENKKRFVFDFYYQTNEDFNKLFPIIKKFQDYSEDSKVKIANFFMDAKGTMDINHTAKTQEEFSKNSENYYPYLDVNETFDQFLLSDSNILLLCGTPGTGKTRLGDMFMKYLLDKKIETPSLFNAEEEDINVAYVKNEDILARDDFWAKLSSTGYEIVFLDDLDYGLLPRTQQLGSGVDIKKNKFISNLLSFTDGIFDKGNSTKFIITTNRSVEEIDIAVLRKGRTFDIFQLRELFRDEAEEIWNDSKITPKFEEHFPVHQVKILQADLGTTIKMIEKAEREHKLIKPYVKEEGISLYSKIKNPKKLGI